MSFFAALVIGEDPDHELAPFHEFESTGRDDEFVVDVDIASDVQERIDEGESLEEALGWHGLDAVSDEESVDKDSTHKYGYAIVSDGKLVKAIDRTNPNKQWDGWSIGGRWPDMLVLKSGRKSNQARRADIDFVATIQARLDLRLARYDEFCALLGGREWPSWEEISEKHKDIDDARTEWRSNPAVASVSNVFGLGLDADPYLVPRDQFIATNSLLSRNFHAVVKDRQWHEEGKMCWFAHVADEKEADAWAQEFQAVLDSCSDDSLLTVVSCHI